MRSDVVTTSSLTLHSARIFPPRVKRPLRSGIKHQHKYITSRQGKNFNKEAFFSNANKWIQFFALILDRYAPTISRRVSDRYTPWLNADYFKLAKTRDKFKMQAVKRNSKLLMESYEQIRNNLNNLNRQLKCEYFSKKIKQF